MIRSQTYSTELEGWLFLEQRRRNLVTPNFQLAACTEEWSGHLVLAVDPQSGGILRAWVVYCRPPRKPSIKKGGYFCMLGPDVGPHTIKS